MKRKITTNTAIKEGLAIQARLQAVNRSIHNVTRTLASARTDRERRATRLGLPALQNERLALSERLNRLYN